jgi:hypothetical protein
MELQNPIAKQLYKHSNIVSTKRKNIRKEKKRRGYLVAGILPDKNIVTIGYSLCHRNDIYDWVFNSAGAQVRSKNFGRKTAINRAIKWGNQDKKQPIPHSILPHMSKFVKRAQEYYKDKKLASWVMPSIKDPIESHNTTRKKIFTGNIIKDLAAIKSFPLKARHVFSNYHKEKNKNTKNQEE